MRDPAAQFGAAAHALNAAGSKDARRLVGKRLREVAKPLGKRVVREGAAQMPHRGGLSARLAKARIGQANDLNHRDPSVTLRFRTREGYDLAALDAGKLKHPVFARPGRRRVWRSQTVPAAAFTRPFEDGAPAVADELIHALNDAAEHVVKQTRRFK